ncbi:bifunctional DNA primase/polymerase [Nocardia farcinica]|uniref:bifunctional DNA primase/polymerase n=1 Tax=Nocardia farcinica TaxID=37329 RepID=UPI000E04DA12|nr:bifunctional DNA primase/polymerase [Nocardia farcinica]MBF6250176.1 bifunctional DNA primase/polymerase [Nocardia farcinica]SUE27742.1 Bifunctional DNA primase/polymerase, N-terminal [Nocardia farcinica]
MALPSEHHRPATRERPTGNSDIIDWTCRPRGRTGSQAPDLLHAAQHAAARGFFVFPLAPGSKKPAVPRHNWQVLATRDPHVITRRWSQAPFNIGIACGPSRLYVLDLDTEPGHRAGPADHGRDVLTHVAAEHGVPYPGPTYRVLTPSGGEHLYFTAPSTPPLRNSVGRLGRGIDTRGVGGYVVAAGSFTHRGRYRLLDDRPPVPLPEWLVSALAPPPSRPPDAVDLRAVRAHAYCRTALARQCRRIATAPVGQRHHILVSAASSIGRLVGAGLLSRTDAHHALRCAADTHIGVDGFTAHESDRTISDGLDYGIARPRRIHLS